MLILLGIQNHNNIKFLVYSIMYKVTLAGGFHNPPAGVFTFAIRFVHVAQKYIMDMCILYIDFFFL